MEGLSERARVFNAAVTESCIPRIDRATVPLIIVQNGKITHDRSGVLFQVGDHCFVLTAAHDLPEMVGQNIAIYVSSNHPRVPPLPLGNAKITLTEVKGRDLAVIRIPPDTAAVLTKLKDFLHHDQIGLSVDPFCSLLLFYGYPERWSGHLITETGMVSQALAYNTFPDPLDPNEVKDYDPQLHVLANYSPTAIQAMSGETHTLPSLIGVSGCGIWQVGDKVGKSAVPRTAQTLTLVGIQHAVYRTRDRVRATRIGFAMELIAEEYPETRAALSLTYR